MTSDTFDCTTGDHDDAVTAAAAAVRRGRLVVLPTDTVYGIGADAFNPTAVNVLLAAKGRGRDMPVPVLVASQSMVDAVVDRMPEPGRALAQAFWPGALTLVVRHTAHLAWDLGDSRGTVAVRMPDHPLAVELIERTGPLAVSSANRSGQPPATTAEEARRQLGAAVAVYLDGGPSPEVAAPSTIVDITDTTPRVLRQGALTVEALTAVVPDLAQT
jgi:L-threonylcarbamoyladenylate synthase